MVSTDYVEMQRQPQQQTTATTTQQQTATQQQQQQQTTTTKKQPIYFKIAELAHEWNVCKEFVRDAINKGDLGATRFGRAIRISRREAERYTLERTKKQA